MLLMERGYQIPDDSKKVAFLIDKKCTAEQVRSAIEEANKLRADGASVSVMRMKKNKKFQKDQLTEQGYTDIREVFND